jgi:uncharacterized membrane protein YciS (DUF1049 family)
MLNLILLVVFALAFGYFSTQNTLTIPLALGPYTITAIPLYVVIGATLLLGLTFAWLISFLDSFTIKMTLRGKENEIKKNKTAIHEMTKKINELQIENANLKGELKNEPMDDISL